MIEISLNKINKSYGFNTVLNDFSMDIKTNQKVALIGPNGCGKTTTFRLIIKEEIPNSGQINIRKESKIGYLKQIPPLESNSKKALDVYLEGIKWLLDLKDELDSLSNNMTSDVKSIEKYSKLREEFEIKGGYLLNEKINRIKNGFKLSDVLLNTEYNKLSGGEKTLINLASLMLSNPDILLLDEPTNHLDIDTLEWFEEYLKEYKGTVVIISHDRYFLDKVVDKVICINNGKEDIYHGNYSYYLKESENRFLIEFQNYKNQQKEIKAIKDAIERYKSWGEKSDNPMFFRRMHALEKRLERIELIDKPTKKRELPISFKMKDRSGDRVLSLENYSMSIENRILLNESSANIYFKDRVCLMGKNGSGKTTLIKNIINKSSNIVLGSNIVIGYIPQEIRFDNDELTIFEYVRTFFKGSEEGLRSKLFQFYFGTESLKKKIKMLSGGEKVRIKLLELIINDINFLILDEPTNHIDIDTRELLENSILDFNGTILFVSHDRYFINKIATKIIKIENNKLITIDGNYDDINKLFVKKEQPVIEEKKIDIKGSNRLNEFIKDAKIDEITIGCSNTKVYKIRKKSKVFYLKIADHLSKESIKLDYLKDKLLCPEKVFYEKYNNKSYILTKSLKGEMLCSDYYINHPLEGIKIIVEAFNAIYNVDYSDCVFDETIDSKLIEIERNLVNEKIIDERYSKRFFNKEVMLKYLKGNKPKSVIGFTHGDMSLPNIFGDNGHFSGVLDVENVGISDIYNDIVTCEISIERNYGKEYVDVFYKELGIEKDEFKSDYYRIYHFI